MGKTNTKRGSDKGPLHCLLVFTFVTTATTLLHQSNIPFSSFLIPALWGMGAILPLKGSELNLLSLGLTQPELTVHLRYYLFTSIIVFPFYAIGFFLYLHQGFTLPSTSIATGVTLSHWVLYNFFAVAFAFCWKYVGNPRIPGSKASYILIRYLLY